ncbi:hypothetical protein [Runella sp. SP2]|uniref:hypothetical protein n=1 Tax=Runella sp. SP2 TaxID=2268026 RepID=UPI000F0841F9|nr:hypothetical protein [Runella sp. SP2]AYQ31955.1 hypothetical protein DTQ70_07120 [Runella sp. SP2]
MATLKQVYKNDLSANQKKQLLEGLARRYECDLQTARRVIDTSKLKSVEEDIKYLYQYHGINLSVESGFYLDLTRLAKIKESGLQMDFFAKIGLSK